MLKIFAIVSMMLMLTACQTTKSFEAISETVLLNFSCDLLKHAPVMPTQRQWDALGGETRRQITANPAFQKVVDCMKGRRQ